MEEKKSKKNKKDKKIDDKLEIDEKKEKVEEPKEKKEEVEEQQEDDSKNTEELKEDEIVEEDNNIPSSKKNKIMIVLIAIASIILLLTIFIVFVPKLILKGNQKIVLKFGEEYNEYGYKASIFGKDLSKYVKVDSNVNANKVGDYNVKYTLKYLIVLNQKERKVSVIDDVKPTITLKGEKTQIICKNKEYVEEGYTATDNYDGDITKNVNVIKEDNIWKYQAQDSSGNKAEETRSITYGDKEQPKIVLSGGSVIYLTVGTKYTEKGYTATDNCDGDISKNVKVSGSVDTNKVGTYNLKYNVEDSSNNKSEVVRKVIVSKNSSSKKTGYGYYSAGGCQNIGGLYLTFDDGPSSVTTPKILNVLKNEGVPATFFVTSSGPDSLILREYNEGHTVALHTSSHNYAKIYSSATNFFNDLESVSNRVKRITGIESKIIRFPGGSSNTVSRRYEKGIMSYLTNEVVNRGYHYFDWNVSSGDAGGCKNSQCVYNNVVKNISKNKCNMVLMHDIKQYTADAIEDIIKYGKSNGYTFYKIDMNTKMVTQRVNN